MASVTLERISKVFAPQIAALRDVSLDVQDGEFVVLVGASGCGKTTALRLIAGLELPSTGRLQIDGRDMAGVPPRRRDVALVFQKPTLYPQRTVRQNLAFGLELHGVAADVVRQRVAEAASALRLEQLLERRPAQLSGGQQQRVALGRALARRAAVTLLDEPLSHLDSPLRAEMRRELHLLHRAFHGTMLHVTHDPVEAMTLADRVVVLDHGSVQQVGPPRTVYNEPANTHVAGFFGWPPMNLLPGKWGDEGSQRFLTVLEGQVKWPWPGAESGSITVGIRPEDVKIAAPGPKMMETDLAACFTMQAAVVETVGSQTVATLRCGAGQLTALAQGRDVREGMEVDVMIDRASVHLFDGISGVALVQGRRSG